MIVEYVWMGDRPIAAIYPNGRIVYIVTDHQNKPRRGIDASTQQIVWSWDPDAFGNVQPLGSVTINLRFPGQYYDQQSGLYYNHNRYYNPKLGRYMEPDPLGLTPGLNPYAYAGSDPVNKTDPTGEIVGVDDAIELGLIIEAAPIVEAEAISAYTYIAPSVAAAGRFVYTEAKSGAQAAVSEGAQVATKVESAAIRIEAAYKRPSNATTVAQRNSVQGKPCVDCGATAARQVADHKTPLVKEYYETGTIDKQNMRSLDAVQPQCPTCSAQQGAAMRSYSMQQKQNLGL
jgi:RHS repeat-associated protein